MGIFELVVDADGTLGLYSAHVGTALHGEDRLFVEPIGEGPDTFGTTAPLFGLFQGTASNIGEMGRLGSMAPSEWRYFVVWAAGSETSTLTIRGKGFEVVQLLAGTSYAFGNSELIGHQGTYARGGARPPAAASSGDAHLGAGIAASRDAGVNLTTRDPLLGLFTEVHMRRACTGDLPGGCVRVGNDMNDAASQVEEGGFADLAIVTPELGYVENPWSHYWVTPKTYGSTWYGGGVPGPYSFVVKHFADATGPYYKDPVAGSEVRLDGEQLILSLAEVDYTSLLSSPAVEDSDG